MENMNKGLTVPKCVLRNWQKIPQNLSAQIVCPSPKVWDFDEKRFHWVFVVRGWYIYGIIKLSERESNVLKVPLYCSGQKGTQATLHTVA